MLHQDSEQKFDQSLIDTSVVIDPANPIALTDMEEKLFKLRKKLESAAALPEQISRKHAKAIIFSAVTTAASCVLYVKGGAQSTRHTIGGPGINIPQNAYYGISTWQSMQQSHRNSRIRMIAAGILGTIATILPVIATAQLTDGDFRYVAPGLTALGNLPNNIFGMYSTISTVFDTLNNNANVRKFLFDKYSESLSFDEKKFLRKRQTRAITLMAGIAGTTILGIPLMAAQAGYVCSGADWMAQQTVLTFGILAGLFADFPTMLISLFIASSQLTIDTIYLLIDLFQHVFGDIKISMTKGDWIRLSTFLLSATVLCYFASFSSGTSEVLYNAHCPNFPGVLSDIIFHNIREGTMAYNGIMGNICFYAFLTYALQAYDTNPKSRAQYLIRSVEDYIRNTPRAELEALVKDDYSLTAAETAEGKLAIWQKPASKPFCWKSRATLFGGSNDYNRLSNGSVPALPTPSINEDDAPNNPSRCEKITNFVRRRG